MHPTGFILPEWKVGQWMVRLVFQNLKLTTTLGNAPLSYSINQSSLFHSKVFTYLISRQVSNLTAMMRGWETQNGELTHEHEKASICLPLVHQHFCIHMLVSWEPAAEWLVNC
jgi:hypothetical protein